MNRKDLKEYFRVLYAPQEPESCDSLLKEASEADADEAGMRRYLAANKSKVYMERAQGAAVEVAKIMLKYGLGQPDPDILAKYLLAAYDEHISPPEDPAYASQFGSHLDDDDKWGDDVGVEDQARFDALNNNKDVTLYRDNPVYRRYYDEEVGDHSEEYKKMTDSFTPYDK